MFTWSVLVFVLFLFSKICFADGYITFPQDANGEYALTTAGSGSAVIYRRTGTGPNDLPFPIFEGPASGKPPEQRVIVTSGVYIGAPRTALEVGTRNAWIAILLHSLATGSPVSIIYSTTSEENAGGINCTAGLGCVIGIGDLTAP